jgi:hypothetical protein
MRKESPDDYAGSPRQRPPRHWPDDRSWHGHRVLGGWHHPMGQQQIRLLTALSELDDTVTVALLTATFWHRCLGHAAQPMVHSNWQAQRMVRFLGPLIEQHLAVACGSDAYALTPQGRQLASWLMRTWDDWPAYAARWLHIVSDTALYT